DLQGAAAVAGHHLAVLRGAIHVPPAAHEALDVRGGAGLAECQQAVLRLRGCDTREGPDLGVGELAVSERPPDLEETAERARRPHPLARGVELDAQPPSQPVGARAGALHAPAAASVELADQVQ